MAKEEKGKREAAAKPEKKQQQRQQQQGEQQAAARKWKGKDWFAILAPKMFNETFLEETPTTDPKSLLGRTVEVSVAELTKQHTKYYMNIRFKVTHIEEKQKRVHTRFYGYNVAKEHIFRSIRKHAEKIQNINDVETKDKWLLQITTITILNKSTSSEVTKAVRKKVEDILKTTADKLDVDSFVKLIINNVLQANIKKTCSTLYPVRFSEIAKIEVKKVPE